MSYRKWVQPALVEVEETIADRTVAAPVTREQPALESLVSPDKPAMCLRRVSAYSNLLQISLVLGKISRLVNVVLFSSPDQLKYQKETHTRTKNVASVILATIEWQK